MIHYTCDRCCKVIDPEIESRYEVRVEINPIAEASSDANRESDEERDHLLEIHNALERELAEGEYDDYRDGCQEELDEESCDQTNDRDRRFDLCPECFDAYAKNPVGRDVQLQLGFSQN